MRLNLIESNFNRINVTDLGFDDIVYLLIINGTLVDFADDDNNTALHLATQNG